MVGNGIGCGFGFCFFGYLWVFEDDWRDRVVVVMFEYEFCRTGGCVGLVGWEK